MSKKHHPLHGKRLKDDAMIVLKLVPEQSDKVSPQMRDILFTLDDNGGKMPLGELFQKLEGVLSTKQHPRKVWKFYRRQLLQNGWIVVE